MGHRGAIRGHLLIPAVSKSILSGACVSGEGAGASIPNSAGTRAVDLDPELLVEFRTAAIAAAAELRALLERLKTDPDAAGRITGLAHKLRGAGGAYGFPDVSNAAGKVEESNLRAMPGRVRKLVAELDRVVVSLVPVASVPSVPRPAEPEPAVPRTRRILLVEDDNLTVSLIKDRLERAGYGVDHQGDGVEALAAAATNGYDVIVIDVKMPRLDGFSVVAKLRASELHAKTPILMLTALGGSQDVVRGFDLGVDDYMRKPFSPAELVARIERLFVRPGR
jgi:CheY-like chemotaxis protein